MIPKFDENGNLSCNPQFIRPSLKEFKERFIEDYIFQNSKTRSGIFDGYKTYCERILIINVAKKQWVDGSYTTKKINPNDIDLVTLYDGIKINNHPEIHDELLDLLNTDKNKEEYKCHAYKIIIWPKEIPDQYKLYIKAKDYWTKWWGMDRQGNKKGIIEFDFSDKDFSFEGI